MHIDTNWTLGEPLPVSKAQAGLHGQAGSPPRRMPGLTSWMKAASSSSSERFFWNSRPSMPTTATLSSRAACTRGVREGVVGEM